MSLDAAAERVLTGTTLADKLEPWPDSRPGGRGGSVPDLPGRPPELALIGGRRRIEPIATARLDTDAGRARVLHELANHELQAIELLALALLRWPDAPGGFRRGLVATLRDEQRHCRMYLDRLEAMGGALGDHPVSRFFWDTLAPVDSPKAFVAGLSLCFEQANLDFCQHWKARFAEAGDPASADVLQSVYEDEIRHVAHGLVWFTRWSGKDRISDWARELPAPLTPARGRGPIFDHSGRRAAGFRDDEIDALRVIGGSRGRPGRAVWLDAGIEDVLADGSRSTRALAVTADLAALPMFLVHAEDVVLAPEPRTAFLARLAAAGFQIPRFAPSVEAVEPVPPGEVIPWGPCPQPLQAGGPAWSPAWRALSSKVEAVRRACALPEHPAVLPAPQRGEVWAAVGDPGPGAWVLKAPFSTSGTRALRGEGPLGDTQRAWVERHLRAHGQVVCQPLYDLVADLSVHVTVGDTVRIDGITRFATHRGVYTGTWLGRWAQGLPPEVRRAAHGDGDAARGMQAPLEEAGRRAGAWAHGLGFRGPISLDAAIVRTPDGLRLHPWLETNARHTLGRVGLALAARVHARSEGWWRVERWSAGRARALDEAAAPEVRDGRVVRGTLATTDPLASRAVLTWLEVDQRA